MNILQDILIPFISSSPQFKSKIENLTGQPVDHVMKCIRNFQDELKKGGGIKDLKIEQQEKFKYLYESGLAMGFTIFIGLYNSSSYALYRLTPTLFLSSVRKFSF